MTKDVLPELFDRDLTRLKEELTLYRDETKIWKIEKEIKNSAGNLALHLIGNLNYFIGAVLGNNGYKRDREAEFTEKNISVEKLIAKIDDTIKVISNVLNNISDEDLEKDYPIEVFKNKGKMKTEYFLIHLTGHLNYHLGQINYHRRLIG